MLTLGIFVVIGALLGMILRFWGFAFILGVVVILYSWFDWQGGMILLLRDLVLVTVALQVGYFGAILIALFLHLPGKDTEGNSSLVQATILEPVQRVTPDQDFRN
jgi:hypothetical protein